MVGSYIAYGHALGRCAGLRFGKVLAIREKEQRHPSDPGVSIRVIGVSDDWDSEPPKLCSRAGTLMYPNRILVLKASAIPDTHRQLLDSYKSSGEKEGRKSAWDRL